MKIVLLSSAASIHTLQWVYWLHKFGIEVIVISQEKRRKDFPSNVLVYEAPYSGVIGYFLNTYYIRRLLREVKPDLIHVHYASGYGTLARLVNIHPYILSVWGSDVYDFPYKSKIHRWLIRKNLYAADKLSSTSYCMMQQTIRIAPNLEIFDVIPFGVDFQKFIKVKNLKEENTIVIGTVKTLSKIYGIDLLIKSFYLLKKKMDVDAPYIASQLRLRIVGGGSDEEQLKKLVERLGIQEVTYFVGSVPHSQVVYELSKLDIYVALSRQESFGVAVIEAGAMGLPAVVSNVGGLPEVVIDKYTGFIVPKENVKKAVEVLEILVMDADLRSLIGQQAKQFIQENYSWDKCVKKMISLYNIQVSEREN